MEEEKGGILRENLRWEGNWIEEMAYGCFWDGEEKSVLVPRFEKEKCLAQVSSRYLFVEGAMGLGFQDPNNPNDIRGARSAKFCVIQP